jgi:photosystem II stability/assembly factor-like uncharacterized protein
VIVHVLALLLSACQLNSAAASPTPLATFLPERPGSTGPAARQLFFESFDMLDARSGWARKGLSQLYRTDDGGSMWREIHLQGRMQVTGASFLGAQEAWLPGVPDAELKQTVYHTTDGGQSWAKLGSVPGPNVELRFHDRRLGWALNGIAAAGNIFYEVYQTSDGGATWRRLDIASRDGADQGPMAGTAHLAAGDTLSFSPPSSIWIASGAGLSTPYAGLSVSRDGGKTWQDVNPPLAAEYVKDQPPVVAIAPQFVTDDDAVLPVTAGNRLVFFDSHDGGSSWSVLPAVLPSTQMTPRVQFVNSKDGFAVCASFLCATQDGGQTWREVPTPFSFDSSGGDHVQRFDFVDASIGWATLVDVQGARVLLKTDDGGRTWIRLMPQLGF